MGLFYCSAAATRQASSRPIGLAYHSGLASFFLVSRTTAPALRCISISVGSNRKRSTPAFRKSNIGGGSCPSFQTRRAFSSSTTSSSNSKSGAQSETQSTSAVSAAEAEAEDLNPAEAAIRTKLLASLGGTVMVRDVSGGCGSMYAIDIASSKFKGLNVVKQHRLVNSVLGEEIKSWHGVQLKTTVL